MTTCIFPETWADCILDLRLRKNEDANFVPALVQVDKDGHEVSFGRIAEVRDGGGHVELFKSFVGAGSNNKTAFDSDADGMVVIHG